MVLDMDVEFSVAPSLLRAAKKLATRKEDSKEDMNLISRLSNIGLKNRRKCRDSIA